MSAADVQTLARSLNDAAVAAGNAVVTDAARQQVWSLLGSHAQEVLRALCAAGEAPAVAGSTEPAAATKPRTSCGIERFPEDVLGAIIAFVDLPMRFTCVAACSTLRDACTRQSPRLEHSLLATRFPLLRTFSNIGTAPSELFHTFKEFEGENGRSRRPESSIALDAYHLSLVITAREIEPTSLYHGGWDLTGTQEAICVGTGELQSEAAPRVVYKFTIPDAAYERAERFEDDDEAHWLFFATVVASRRDASGKLQFAKLVHEHCRRDESNQFEFDISEMPIPAGNQALNFYKYKADNVDMYTDPQLELDMMGPSAVRATFRWQLGPTPIEEDFMTEQEARACLEHYAAWSD